MDAFVRGLQGGLSMSEQRLIDAEALLKRLKEIHHMDGIKMRLEVEYAPTIDPVRHGKWVIAKDKDGFAMWYACSSCGHGLHYVCEGKRFPYCPNCGAKMDKECE